MSRINITTALAALSLFVFSPTAYAAEKHDHKHDEKAEGKKEEKHEEHEEHAHEAPHGGTLVVLGDEHAAHIEFVFDSAKGQLTGYILDGEAAKAIRISQPDVKLQISGGDVASSLSLTLKPVESPLTGEKAGSTSQFEAADPALKGKKKFEITIPALNIRGVDYKNTVTAFPEGNH